MNKLKATLLTKTGLNRVLIRLSHEIMEKHASIENLALIGIRTRGEIIAKGKKATIICLGPLMVRQAIEAKNDLKKNRNIESIKSILNKLKTAANTNENIIPIIIQAVKEKATLGEISDTLREVFGEYKG